MKKLVIGLSLLCSVCQGQIVVHSKNDNRYKAYIDSCNAYQRYVRAYYENKDAVLTSRTMDDFALKAKLFHIKYPELDHNKDGSVGDETDWESNPESKNYILTAKKEIVLSEKNYIFFTRKEAVEIYGWVKIIPKPKIKVIVCEEKVVKKVKKVKAQPTYVLEKCDKSVGITYLWYKNDHLDSVKHGFKIVK